MISGMKAAGFSHLRIPVAWSLTMDFENGNYIIRDDHMDRVAEIIQYALNEDMFVIVNCHWDGGWWGMFGSATESVRERAMDMFTAMWDQLSARFEGFDHRLIFEAANEELGGRFNDKDYAPDSGTLNMSQCYELLTVVTQRFVDTVRASGGNNADRFLLIPGYDTDIVRTCDSRYRMPVDTADDKLLISVHYYTPWGYCGTPSLTSWGKERDYEEQNRLLGMMTKFTEQGIGVVIGEYSVAFNSDRTVKDNTVDFYENFLNNCDLYGYASTLWDTNGMYRKDQLKVIDDGVAELFLSRSNSARLGLTVEEIMKSAEEAIAYAYAESHRREQFELRDDEAYAWIMFNSGDWLYEYSVGDRYNPQAISGGVIATDARITGPGTYTRFARFHEYGERLRERDSVFGTRHKQRRNAVPGLYR
jgi:endoglucanase